MALLILGRFLFPKLHCIFKLSDLPQEAKLQAKLSQTATVHAVFLHLRGYVKSSGTRFRGRCNDGPKYFAEEIRRMCHRYDVSTWTTRMKKTPGHSIPPDILQLVRLPGVQRHSSNSNMVLDGNCSTNMPLRHVFVCMETKRDCVCIVNRHGKALGLAP